MWRSIISFAFLAATVSSTNDTLHDDCTENAYNKLPLAQKKEGSGRVRLIGLFDVHEGENCQLLIPGGMKQVIMTIGEFENQLQTSELNALEINFELYDTCSSSKTALVTLMNALKFGQSRLKECEASQYVGVIGPLNTKLQYNIKTFLEGISIPYFPLQVTSLKYEVKAMSQVLVDLKWLSVALFASSKSLDGEFREEANKNDICIASSTLFSTDPRVEKSLKEKLQKLTTLHIQVAVVLGSNINLQKLYEMSIALNSSIQYWLVAGSETNDPPLSMVFGPDHPVIMFRKSSMNLLNIDQNIVDTYKFNENINQLNLVQNYIDYVNNCLKNASETNINDIHCQSHHFKTHSSLWHIIEKSMYNLLQDVSRYMDINGGNLTNHHTVQFNINNNASETNKEIEIWTFQHAIGKFSTHKETLVGHYNESHLVWDKKRANVFRFSGSGWFKIPEFQCRRNCHDVCENFESISVTSDLENLLNRIYYWKYETWITILMTTSSVGILIALLTGTYLISRACREDFEEGNQASNIMLLIAVIFSFSCSALFLLQNDTATCSKRIAIVGLAYASMLAPILSRCLLLIASESDGIHGHISGLLQCALTFFIFAVQVPMASYYWIMNVTESRIFKPKCTIHTKMTLAYLSYPMLLSFWCLITSPFCIRNLRNNREGLLLHLSSVAICLIWLVWCLLFFLLGPRWNEFTICFGLVATASAIILFMYLPKVYRMIVFAAGRDHGQVSMQPVIFASTSSRSPNPSIYESINHGYNPDKDGYIVDVFRDDIDSPAPRKMTHL